MVSLSHEIGLDPQRAEYHRAVVTVGKDGVLYAASTGNQRSSMVGSLKSANALLCLESGKEPLAKGSKVEALLMARIRSDFETI
jgi:gephyrin